MTGAVPHALAALSGPRERAGWDGEVMARGAGLLPTYEGTAEPVAWNRVPGEALTH